MAPRAAAAATTSAAGPKTAMPAGTMMLAAVAVAAAAAAVGIKDVEASTPGVGGCASLSTASLSAAAAPSSHSAARTSARLDSGSPSDGHVSSGRPQSDNSTGASRSVGGVRHQDSVVEHHVARRSPAPVDLLSQIDDAARDDRIAADLATAAARDGLFTRGTTRRRSKRPPQNVARGGAASRGGVASRGGGGQASGRGVGSRGRGRGGHRRGRDSKENCGVGQRGSSVASDNSSDGAPVRGVIVIVQKRLLIFIKWAREVAFCVTTHASSARTLQLH